MNTLTKIPAGIPGITMERNALVIADDITDDALHELGQRLATMDGALAWWLGDYGLALQKRKGDPYVKGKAEALGISEQYWWVCVSVCRFFAPLSRDKDVSFKHHLVAMQIARAIQTPATGNAPPPLTYAPDTIASGLALVSHAKCEGLSVSELRKHGRTTLASPAKYAAEPEVNTFDEMDQADKWAIRHKDMAMTGEEAFYFSIRWQALIQLVERVKSEAVDQAEAA